MSTNNKTVQGPLVEFAAGAFLGNDEKYFISNKYLTQDEPLSGNYILYNFNTEKWNWITKFSSDSLNRWIKPPRPNPQGEELVFTRYLENAWQLFTMDSDGNNMEQLTELGSSEPSWSKDGKYIYFNRDTHKAPGARYIPHFYELAAKQIQPLWPNLPDSVPEFPTLETQSPIDFYAIVKGKGSFNL